MRPQLIETLPVLLRLRARAGGAFLAQLTLERQQDARQEALLQLEEALQHLLADLKAGGKRDDTECRGQLKHVDGDGVLAGV